jgi:aspartate racemase
MCYVAGAIVKTLGIIGGIGPESTIEYYRTIIRLYRERARDGAYPKIIINSINLTREVDLLERGELGLLAASMVEEVNKLAQAGSDFALMASNTPHIVFGEIEPKASIPLLSIVETACAEVKQRGLKRVGLFGTRFTMGGKFYQQVFAREKIELIAPEPDDQDFIHDKYMNELVAGTFLPETKNGLLRIMESMKAKKNVDAIILAGTELPLILREPAHEGIPIIDTMRAHAAAAVEEMFRP